MESNLLTAVFLPLALAFIMMGMGLSLRPDDFRRIVTAPKAAVVGLAAQLVLLPVVGFLLVKLFGLTGALAVGLMIIAACPGGPTSNLVSHLARGDLALSISLTAVSSLITIITIPLIVNLSIGWFGEEGSVTLPVLRTIVQIMGVTLIPVAIGMLIRRRNPVFSKNAERPVKIISAAFFTLIVIAALVKERENLPVFFVQTGPAVLTLNAVTMSAGFALAFAFGLSARQRLTVAIESGIQNGTMGIMIAATLLQNPVMVIPIAMYGILMYGSAVLVIFLGNKFIRPEKTKPELELI